jgi:lysozyme
MRTLGIDVSHYQKDVNWQMVAENNVRFAFAKASEGTGVDAYFQQNWSGIQEAGLYRGAYHYGHPGMDAETQSAHFASVVGPLGLRDLPPVLDLEASDGHDAAYVLKWARTFVAKAEALFGRKLIIYTGQFWRGPMGNPKDDFFRTHALWLAGYTTETKLVIPASWSHWTFWQYSDGTFNKPAGVTGVSTCDQSVFEGGDDELNHLCEVSQTPEQPPANLTDGESWPGTYFICPHSPAVSGNAVRHWQDRMIQLGYEIDCDGVYGPQSKRACAVFQRNQGLVADGIVGKATWDATFAASA